jgi:RNA polymerase sigma factor (sigma-70 family)
MTLALTGRLAGLNPPARRNWVQLAWAKSVAPSTYRLCATYDGIPMTDEDIIDAFRSGDDRATAALYERYGRLVFTVCLRVLTDRSRAEDAVQQTFVQAWRSASSFDATRSFGPWLATIARRVSIDLLRREARHQNESLVHNEAALISLPPNAEQIEAVWKVREAIDALNSEDRQLIKMQHFDGAQHAEIAEHLGIPVGTVKSRAFRIHRDLARTLSALRNDAEGGEA